MSAWVQTLLANVLKPPAQLDSLKSVLFVMAYTVNYELLSTVTTVVFIQVLSISVSTLNLTSTDFFEGLSSNLKHDRKRSCWSKVAVEIAHSFGWETVPYSFSMFQLAFSCIILFLGFDLVGDSSTCCNSSSSKTAWSSWKSLAMASLVREETKTSRSLFVLRVLRWSTTEIKATCSAQSTLSPSKYAVQCEIAGQGSPAPTSKECQS